VRTTWIGDTKISRRKQVRCWNARINAVAVLKYYLQITGRAGGGKIEHLSGYYESDMRIRVGERKPVN